MGIFSFLKETGEKIFGSDAEAAADKAQEIQAKLQEYGVEGVDVSVDDSTVTLTGQVNDPKDQQKAIVIAGNIEGIDTVDDQITYSDEVVDAMVAADALAEQMYEVKAGDTLSHIAQEMYGDAQAYHVIFEANRPMLSDPDKIYVGQVLIIPKRESEQA